MKLAIGTGSAGGDAPRSLGAAMAFVALPRSLAISTLASTEPSPPPLTPASNTPNPPTPSAGLPLASLEAAPPDLFPVGTRRVDPLPGLPFFSPLVLILTWENRLPFTAYICQYLRNLARVLPSVVPPSLRKSAWPIHFFPISLKAVVETRPLRISLTPTTRRGRVRAPRLLR